MKSGPDFGDDIDSGQKSATSRRHTVVTIDPLKALLDILRMEVDQGFPDTTVAGGLDKFLRRREADLAPILDSPTSYTLLTPPQRRKWADDVLARLSRKGVGGQEHNPVPDIKRASTKKKNGKGTPVGLGDSVYRLRWVTERTFPRNKLKRLGVRTVGDLIYHLPNRHEDFANIQKISELKPGEEQTVITTVWDVSAKRVRPNLWSVHAVLGDETGNITATWFRRGHRNRQPLMADSLQREGQIVFSGKVGVFRGGLILDNPEYELLNGQEDLVHTGRLVPVYPTVEGLPLRTLRRAVKQALDGALPKVTDYLPQDVLGRLGLMDLRAALAQSHYPDSEADKKAATRRLAFDELLTLQLAVLRRKKEWQQDDSGLPIRVERGHIDQFSKSLPFEFTDSQTNVIDGILGDLEKSRPMSRLLQGDVGSGKTVVAVAALLSAVFAGYQGAIIAPTEILAEQHYLTISRLLSGGMDPDLREDVISVKVGSFPKLVQVGMLVGSLPKKLKEKLRKRLADGEIDVVVGTHALIQDDVQIPRLAVAIVDEQHRFGVMQRAALRDKGHRPHLLAMSATPIPRSLALTLYGELDVSVLDEMPSGRQPIRTRWLEPDRRVNAYEFIARQVQEGRQAFVICPLVEESEIIQTRAAVEEHERLSRQIFPNLRLGLLHGRMSLPEKQAAMEEFQNGGTHVLVSTPVVEVGIDVPNATVMLIDGAERFGLAQLHQFRGRVGRGEHRSYCLLLADDAGQEARERLKIVERVSDGFELAEEDLRIRGPGDYVGTRQSGLPNLKVAKVTDHDLLLLARREATRILDIDPALAMKEHSALARHLDESTDATVGEIS